MNYIPLNKLETPPKTFSRRSTRLNTAPTNQNMTIFSFTEVLEGLNKSPSQQTIMQKQSSRASPNEMNQQMFENGLKNMHDATEKMKLESINDISCFLRTKSEEPVGVFDDNTISTNYTLQTLSVKNKLRSQNTKQDYFNELLEKSNENVIIISEFEKEKNLPSKTTQGIQKNMDAILDICKQLNKDVSRIQKLRHKTEINYVKELEDIGDKLDNPVPKFEFWKKDKHFIKHRTEIKQEINKFRLNYKESQKEQENMDKINKYIPKSGWEDEDKKDLNFNSVEQLLLKEPRPFRIKKVLSKEAQFDLRPKAFDLLTQANENQLKENKESSKKASISSSYGQDLQERSSSSKEMSDQILEKYSQGKSTSYLEEEILLTKECIKKYQNVGFDNQNNSGTHKFLDQLSTSSSSRDSTSNQICSNKVYYFSNIKNIRGHSGNPAKDKPKRYCQPISDENQSNSFQFKNDFLSFKKSSMIKRNLKVSSS